MLQKYELQYIIEPTSGRARPWRMVVFERHGDEPWSVRDIVERVTKEALRSWRRRHYPEATRRKHADKG